MTRKAEPEARSASRIDLYGAWPEGFTAMRAFSDLVKGSGLDPILQELVRLRASQINGCAFCIDMHAIEARRSGETEQRMYALPAWHESPFFTERERAALRLCEAITLAASAHVPDDVLDAARRHFTETELSQLVFTIVAINAWNRLELTAQRPRAHYPSVLAAGAERPDHHRP